MRRERLIKERLKGNIITPQQTRVRGFEIISYYKDKNINLPKRQTLQAAGYDVEAAEDIIIPSIWRGILDYIRDSVKTVFHRNQRIPEFKIEPTVVTTGIKAYFPKDEVLYLYNRSSNPINRGLVLANSVGVIDADYYNNEKNEGHIMFMFYNFSPFDVHIKKGERIGQAVFSKILLIDGDEPLNKERKQSGSTGTN